MNFAAVPSYMGNDFSKASPGLRHGIYFPVWSNTNNFAKVTGNNSSSNLKQACKLNDNDKEAMSFLLERQKALFREDSAHIGTIQLDAISTSPFTTGLGNEHPSENGFAFLNPFGLPYLPGSSVKGVLRQAARDLATGEWGDNFGRDSGQNSASFEGSDNPESIINLLFGNEDSNNASRGALIFWDVIPQIRGSALSIEIMTPHYRDYFQAKNGNGSDSPHECGQPNPISFLSIPAGSGFTFLIQCNLNLLRCRLPDLVAGEEWKYLLKHAFEHAFAWLGFGAKSALGYGAMQEDETIRAEREKQLQQQQEKERISCKEQERQREIANMSPEDKVIAECLDARVNRDQLKITALIEWLEGEGRNRDDELVKKVAAKIKEKMQRKEEGWGKWRETSNKKNPNRDKDYTNTMIILKYLE